VTYTAENLVLAGILLVLCTATQQINIESNIRSYEFEVEVKKCPLQLITPNTLVCQYDCYHIQYVVEINKLLTVVPFNLKL